VADYRSTVFLPSTAFPMKAGLPNLERDLLARWQRIDLYAKLRARATGREKFILHDGPPYANGHIHIGTAVNKILKDIVTRAQQMLGKDSNYVPGWDCHGLPIEWQVEQRHREAGRRKEDIPLAEFRRECRAFAEHWIGVQRDEFRRLGVVGDWDHPYTTMSYAAEAQIAAEILKFLMSGALYRGAKPVLWSVVEKTALAEAEVEYQDHTSTTIHVRFRPLVGAPAAIAGASLVIWTTTPWTIPGNRGIAFSAAAEYVRVRVLAVTERSLAIVGEEIIIAEPLLADVCAETGIAEHTITGRFAGAELEGARCAHPSTSRSMLATSSRWNRAQASCTSRPDMVPTTTTSGSSTGSRCRTRWARTAPISPLYRFSAATTCSRSIGRSPTSSPRSERCWHAAGWCTATRTPGARRRRSSSATRRSGSSA